MNIRKIIIFWSLLVAAFIFNGNILNKTFAFTDGSNSEDSGYSIDSFEVHSGPLGALTFLDNFDDDIEPPHGSSGAETYIFDCILSLAPTAETDGLLNLNKEDGCQNDTETLYEVILNDPNYLIQSGQSGSVEAVFKINSNMFPESGVGLLLFSQEESVFSTSTYEGLYFFLWADINGNLFLYLGYEIGEEEEPLSIIGLPAGSLDGILEVVLKLDIDNQNSVTASLDLGGNGIDYLLPDIYTLAFDQNEGTLGYAGGFDAVLGYTAFCFNDFQGYDNDIDGADLSLYLTDLSRVDLEDFAFSFGSLGCDGPRPVWNGDYYIQNLEDLNALSGYGEVTGSLFIQNSTDLIDLTGLEMLTRIGANLIISGNQILTNLTGLEGISSTGVSLQIYDNPLLNSLSGLDNLNFVGGELQISLNASLANFSGLNSLSSIGARLYISNNVSLTSFLGLENLMTIANQFYIGYNDSLINFVGLNNLTSIGGRFHFENNISVTSLTGLGNLVTIGGDLKIRYNSSLITIAALANLTSIGNDVEIERNISLTSLTGLDNLTSINGSLQIYGNSALVDLAGLENIVMIDDSLNIADNNHITHLNELNKLTTIGGNLYITELDALTSLSGLNKLSSIGGGLFIQGCDVLPNPSGMTSLTHNGRLYIHDNDLMTSLSGLEFIMAVNGDLEISYNDLLTDLAG
ncbi:MAG: hypothetical protein GY699_06555, partial [Desulfobacteraceae bacterium]|nr:hypothetical protein [Desulfobacteraceae bacterium]